MTKTDQDKLNALKTALAAAGRPFTDFIPALGNHAQATLQHAGKRLTSKALDREYEEAALAFMRMVEEFWNGRRLTPEDILDHRPLVAIAWAAAKVIAPTRVA